MKNIMVIDGADNCAYDVFQATEEEFRSIFPANDQDVAFAEELGDREEGFLIEIYQRPLHKTKVQGLHGMLFVGCSHKKIFYPNRRDSDLDGRGRPFLSADLL
ncbi:hypothetical protein [Oryzifoliimicrobium ureilyticus]|uniref:hypothetical protein n=1 Tax=Oryzifoliimicrobium ureilyticus TaxID=3113724 RepID=UPI00307686E9